MNNHQDKKRLVSNIVYNGLYQVLIMIVPIITTPYVTRIFNVGQMGSYGASLALANIFTISSKLGLTIYGNRKIAESDNKEDRSVIFWSLWKLQFAATLLSFCCYAFFSLFFSTDKNLYLVQSILILTALLDVSWFFIGMEELRTVVLRNTFSKIFSTIAVFIFIHHSSQMNFYALIIILGILFGNISMWFGIRKHIMFGKYIYAMPNRGNLKSTIILVIPQVINNMYTNLDRNVLLAISSSSSAVGIYDQGRKIMNLFLTIINSSIDALMPRLAYIQKKNQTDTFKIYVNKTIQICSFFSVISISGILSVSEYFVSIFFGPGYDAVSTVLRLGSIGFLYIPISVFISSGIMIAKKQDKRYFMITVLLAALSLTFNLILDKKYIYIGAITAYLLAEFIGFIIRILSVPDMIQLKFILFRIGFNALQIIISVAGFMAISRYLMFDNAFITFAISALISFLLSFLIFIAGTYLERIVKNLIKKEI